MNHQRTSAPFQILHLGCLLSALGLVVACGSPSVASNNPGPTVGGVGGGSGATAANGGTGNEIDVGPGDGGANGEADPDMQTCASNAQQVALVPLDMGLAVDTSFSMDFNAKWSQVHDALNVFAKNPNYVNMGVAL